MLANGQIATQISGSWFGGFLKSWIDPKGAGKWGVIPIPEDPQQNWGGSFLAIPEQSQNKEAAWAFIEYAMANADAQNRMFVNVDYFPSFTPAWDNPLYEEGDPYFGGQKTASCGPRSPIRRAKSSPRRWTWLPKPRSVPKSPRCSTRDWTPRRR